MVKLVFTCFILDYMNNLLIFVCLFVYLFVALIDCFVCYSRILYFQETPVIYWKCFTIVYDVFWGLFYSLINMSVAFYCCIFLSLSYLSYFIQAKALQQCII